MKIHKSPVDRTATVRRIETSPFPSRPGHCYVIVVPNTAERGNGGHGGHGEKLLGPVKGRASAKTVCYGSEFYFRISASRTILLSYIVVVRQPPHEQWREGEGGRHVNADNRLRSSMRPYAKARSAPHRRIRRVSIAHRPQTVAPPQRYRDAWAERNVTGKRDDTTVRAHATPNNRTLYVYVRIYFIRHVQAC